MSEHNCGQEDCNCEEDATVTLTLDNDEVVDCAVLTIFEVEGTDYIALLPLNENGETEDGEVFLYRFIEEEGKEPDLENIADDDEYEKVADAFDEWLDEQDFDDLDSDE